jgi:NAD(P)-dependent dehydrogenase (short-subunit alcohol dehydrogenase family)
MGVLDTRGNLRGRKAAIIGGAGGIGKAVTLALVAAEVDVAFCDIDEAAVKTTRAEIAASRANVVAEVADALEPAQLRRFYSVTQAAFGHVDIVVNVVGGVLMQPFMEKSSESCAEDIQRNFGYVIESTRLAVPLLRKSGRGGAIVNFTTIEAHRGAGGFAVYAAAKAATTNFSRAMAWELGPEGIRVNVVAPDTTASEGNRKALPEPLQAVNAAAPAEWWDRSYKMYIPLGVPPSADDLSNAVLFLVSDLSRSITGQVIHVDGGTAAALGMIRWSEDENVTLPLPSGATLAQLFGGK